MSEPRFLTLDQVLRIHARSLAEHGGSDGTRDNGLVDSALASAKNTYYYANGDLYDIAASYAFHLAESQAFVDGNKRTAVTSAMVFLAMNGVYAQPPTWDLYTAMIDVAEKKKTKNDLAGIFRNAGR
ncbi:MAG TPA: type II toxin-antitoxin system death-on-curing family toxin [Candidatus Sulfotelmatobacter sp.]|nr:type II toxin-antitoxin system death-on-curing family toxin [Candidatus Sulfotelmatobacter sp.]